MNRPPILSIFLLLFLTACSLSKENTNLNPTTMNDNSTNKNESNPELENFIPKKEIIYTIGNPEKITLENLDIGIGNIWSIDKRNADEKQTYSAGMWLYHPNDSAKDSHLRIKEGQIVDAGSYRIRVVEIPDDTGVILGVSKQK